MKKLIYKDLSYKIIGSVFKVFNKLGYGYQEKYYQRALALEFEREGLKCVREKEIKLNYQNETIGKYFLDFIIENKIVLELKVANIFYSQDIKQILSYLRAGKLKLGILIVITKEGIKYKRLINVRD